MQSQVDAPARLLASESSWRRSALERVKVRIGTSAFPLRLAQEIRIEAHLGAVRLRNRLDPGMRRCARELARLRELRLHFGCGSRVLEGWINLDGWSAPGIDYVCDLRVGLPLADDSCAVIFSEHVLEHFDPQFVPRVLGELRRVLRSGGTLRIVVPDCAKFARAYASGDLTWFRTAVPDAATAGDALNDTFRNHFHRFAYDFETLAGALRQAGFREIRESAHQASALAELRIDQEVPSRIVSNLYLEARK